MAINPIQQNNLDLFKKKKPKEQNNTQTKAPYVGVVDAPEFSKTPINDTLRMRDGETKSEPPKAKKQKMDRSIKFDILAVLGCLTGISIAIFNKIKKR